MTIINTVVTGGKFPKQCKSITSLKKSEKYACMLNRCNETLIIVNRLKNELQGMFTSDSMMEITNRIGEIRTRA